MEENKEKKKPGRKKKLSSQPTNSSSKEIIKNNNNEIKKVKTENIEKKNVEEKKIEEVNKEPIRVKETILVTQSSMEENKEKKEDKKKSGIFSWFKKKPENEETTQDSSLSSPSGESLISNFEESSIENDVMKTLKKKSFSEKLPWNKNKKKKKKNDPIKLLNDKIDKCTRFNPSIKDGLTSKQVHQRMDEGLINKSLNKYTRSYWEIIKSNVFTFFNILLTTIGVALMIFNRYSDCFFLFIMLANLIIGIVQEIRSKKMIEKLRLVTAPTARVIRDGKEITIPTDQLVIDDIVLLSNGEQISADSIVLDGTIEVNESLLTGESLSIKKEKNSIVYAGSYVISGSCYVLVDKVAESNWAISIQSKAKKFSKNKSELLKALNSIIRVISLIILPIAACIFTVNWLNAPSSALTSLYDRGAFAISKTAGPIVGMVPSGMYLLTSIALAVGVIRLAKRKTLVQDLYCFEMLARTNVLCLDKTGTLTDGTMEINEIIYLHKDTDLNGIMGSYLNSFIETNQTSIALSQYFTLNNKFIPSKIIPFSSIRKYSAVSFKDNGTYILGAPEFIYKIKDKNLINAIETRQKQGYRVVLLAHSNEYLEEGDDSSLPINIEPVALFVLIDHIRNEAPDTIAWFQNNGVEIKIISGDNPYTASEIALKCGVKDATKCISLAGLSTDEILSIVNKYTVFGRVSPEQKAVLIKALKNSGKTVAMTGDGVNDILAMKQADCSIAMASGAEAPKNIAQLVLLDSNFSSMPSVVLEGRRVINNIQRSSALFLMKTIFTGVLVTFFIILGFSTVANSSLNVTYPFSSGNLMLMEFVGIGVPSFFLALQPNKEQIKGHFIRNTFSKAIPGAICLLFSVGAIFILAACNVFNEASDITFTDSSVITMCVLVMTSISISVLYCLSKPLNGYRSLLITGDVLLAIFMVFVCPLINIPILGTASDGSLLTFFTLNKTQMLITLIFIFAAPIFTSIVFYLSSPDTYSPKELKK